MGKNREVNFGIGGTVVKNLGKKFNKYILFIFNFPDIMTYYGLIGNIQGKELPQKDAGSWRESSQDEQG